MVGMGKTLIVLFFCQILHSETQEYIPVIGKYRVPDKPSITSLQFSPGGNDFYQRYLLRYKPLLIKGACRYWPAVNGQWNNLSFVNDIFSEETLPVLNIDGNVIEESYFGKIIEFKMRVNARVPNHSQLLEGIFVPLVLQCNDMVKKLTDVLIRMNDHESIHVQYNDKDVLLVPFADPITINVFGVNGTFSGDRFKEINMQEIDVHKHAFIYDTPYQVIDVMPGDLFYLPAHSWFHITSKEKIDYIQIQFKAFNYSFDKTVAYTTALEDYKSFLLKQETKINCQNTETNIKDALTIDFTDEENILHLRIPKKNKRPDDVVLASGHKMPVLGLGTALLYEKTKDAVKYSLSIGYRMFDSAYGYPLSEVGIAKALSESEVERAEVFFVTKLHPRYLGYNETLHAIDLSLENLNTSYIDLYLIHSTVCDDFLLKCEKGEPKGTWKESWRAMEVAVRQGKIRSIGVSNFFQEEIIELLNWSVEPVSVIQNWFDPFNQDMETREVCAKYNIRYMGYSTLGSQWKMMGLSYNPVMESDLITAIAGHYDYVISHVVLRWAIHVNVTVIPRSANPNHIAQNLRSLDLSLHPSDIDNLNDLSDWFNELALLDDE